MVIGDFKLSIRPAEPKRKATLEVTINTLSGVEQEAEIAVTDAELQPLFARAYEKYRQKIELKGFRKGKAPMELIRKLYGEAIEQDSLDTVATEFYRKAMAEKNIRPIGQPAMTDMDFKRGEAFRFKIKYEVRPAIELRQYKGIAVEKPVHKITDAEINAEIEHLRRVNSTTEEVQKVTDSEHVATGDVQELDATGAPLIGKKTPNARFLLSDQTLAKEIRECLAGAEVNGVYRTSFESRHGDHSHPVHISISVTKIEKVNLPAFDDPFVKKITQDKVGTTTEFLSNIRLDLERYWEEQSDRKLSDGIAAALVRAHNFEVPETLVNTFLDAFIEDIKSRSRDKKLPRDFDEQKFRTESHDYAIWQAKWMLLKERVAESEGIDVTEDDIEALAATESARIGVAKDRLLEYYKNSSAAAERILTGKVMAFLKQNALITERVVEDQPEK